MISKELLKKIRKIEINSSKLVEEVFSGEYRTGFKGKGMEFDSIRQYYIGDDIRSIDWNVTARHNKTFVKQFTEEREMNMFLIVDMSRSNSFAKKSELIAELCATLAFSATKNNDKVGMILFTEKVEKFIPSKSGKKHVLSIIESILNFKPKYTGTNISSALDFFTRISKKSGIVFLLSDFFDSGYHSTLKLLSKKHDLVSLRVIDKSEEKLPKGAIFFFEDLETGETLVVDNINNSIQLNMEHQVSKRNLITIYTHENYIIPLKTFFKRRCRP